MRRICDRIRIAASLPKTLYFCFRYLPFNQAKKLPVFVYYKTKILDLSLGNIQLCQTHFGIIRIGFPQKNFPAQPVLINISGKLTFVGKASIQAGTELNVSGDLCIGDNFRCNEGTKINVKDTSYFGDDVLIGHECFFSDDDGHKIIQDGVRTNEKKGYKIGNHVWIARGCMILKGVELADNVVVGAGTIVTRRFSKNNVIIAGSPAKIIKENIDWEH